MLRKTGRLAAFGMLICLLLWTWTAAAEGLHATVENPALEMEVQAGYDGKVTFGKAIPVRVTVRNRGEDLEGTLAVNAYVNTVKYDRYETEISVPSGGERTIVLPVTAETRQGIFTAEILRDGEVICAVNDEPEGVINPSAMMIGVLSTRPWNLASLDISQENDTLYRYEYWQTVPLTPETLPEDAELLNSFGMIVLDDVDPALLTEKQQKAMQEWIRQGRVLLCGGGTAAPQNLAFLGDMTVLRAAEFTVSDGVHAALESLIGQAASGKRPETALARINGGEPMVSDKDGNGLIWRETAGAGRIYVLAWEAGDPALNAESLMHVFYQQLLVQYDSSLYNNMLYLSENSGALSAAGDYTALPVHNSLPAALIILGGMMLMGLLLWFVLKKHDATRWMWAVLPLLALAAGAVITVMSFSSMLNRPVAAVTVNLVQDEDGIRTRWTSLSAAAPGTGMHRYSLEGEKLKVRLYDDYWQPDDEEETPKEPVTLRSVRTSGANGSIAVNADTPWKSVEMYASRVLDEGGAVDAEIWMESDGFHGTVKNGTEYTLQEGVVLSIYGFVRIPALAPGESADFALIAEDAADPSNPAFENGKMLRNASASFYTMINWVCFGNDVQAYEYGYQESALAGLMGSAADYLATDRSRGGGFRQEGMTFIYSAQPKESFDAQVYADGEKVETLTVIPLVTTAVQYRTVGRTGVVFHVPGMDVPVRCELDNKGLPAGDMKNGDTAGKTYAYYELSELPTFRFSPEDVQDVEIDRLLIGVEQWYLNDLKCYLLNPKLKTWVEILPNTPVKQPEQYLDADGNLYCQFRPSASGDSYVSIPAPTMTLEGRVKNADPE